MPPQRTTHHWLWFEQLFSDLRYAWRGLWKSRAFTATTVLTLAVGLGLITVVFTIFDAYVLRPFAVRDPYSLHVVGWESKDMQGWRFSWREFLDLRGRRDLFEDVSAERTQFVLSGGRQLYAGFVSGNYFDMLGARVSQGRPLADFDVQAPGRNAVAVLSDQAWARLFNRDASAIGRTIELNREPLVIVGVMRPEFSGLDDSPRDLWVRLAATVPGVARARPAGRCATACRSWPRPTKSVGLVNCAEPWAIRHRPPDSLLQYTGGAIASWPR
jgi:hypothetical protein